MGCLIGYSTRYPPPLNSDFIRIIIIIKQSYYVLWAEKRIFIHVGLDKIKLIRLPRTCRAIRNTQSIIHLHLLYVVIIIINIILCCEITQSANQ